jgi:hypothetical protein
MRLILLILIGMALIGCSGDEQLAEKAPKKEYDYSNLEYKELSILKDYTLTVPIQTIDSVYADKDGIYTTFLVLNDILFSCQSVGVSNQFIPARKEGLHDSIRDKAIIIDDTISSYWLFAIDWGEIISYSLIDTTGITFPIDLSAINGPVDTTSIIDMANFIDTAELNLESPKMHSCISIEVRYDTPEEKKVILDILNSLKEEESSNE